MKSLILSESLISHEKFAARKSVRWWAFRYAVW